VSILQKNLLAPVLGIGDPRTDDMIDFVGGIRGLGELARRVDEGEAIAFALFSTSIKQFMDITDTGEVMPPKSTWFEPKLRSGLFYTFYHKSKTCRGDLRVSIKYGNKVISPTNQAHSYFSNNIFR
jgi:uncharacterized protein (DUF1015 family)